MDRIHALRDTANLPRAIAPPLHLPAGSSTGGMEQGMNDSGLDMMQTDDSLTDMQWLQRMDAGSEIPGFVHKAMKKRCRSDKDKENQRTSKPTRDGCRKRLQYDSTSEGSGEKPPSNKPPLSYASLIVLAISSTPQRMLTLSGIYRWIESTFPFYRTPESKAWKNSIRHNLSIRKNMFVKVYQLPPRRGNGSYWSLLADGEAELKKAHPLFMTLLPPVIDEDCAYCRVPITHTVKSRGQFMPVLPQTTRKMPYFALNSSDFNNSIVQSSLSSVRQRCESDIATAATKLAKRHKHSSTMTAYSSTPKHLTEHSYAKAVTFEPEFQRVEVELAPEDMVEGSFVLHPSDTFVQCESKQSYYGRGEGEEQGNSSTGTTNFQVGVCDSTTDDVIGGGASSSRQCTTPGPSNSDTVADCSLTSLLGASFLTPMKTASMPDISLDAISFSPLYNFVTPQRDETPPTSKQHHRHPTTTSSSSSHTPCPRNTHSSKAEDTSPFTPCAASTVSVARVGPVEGDVGTQMTSSSSAVSDFDSGVFSPFGGGSLRFSTPLVMKGVSPLVDLPGNVFNTPSDTTPLRSSSGAGLGTSTRKTGSRQLFTCTSDT